MSRQNSNGTHAVSCTTSSSVPRSASRTYLQDGYRKGYVKLRPFSWQALLPEHSATIQTLLRGILGPDANQNSPLADQRRREQRAILLYRGRNIMAPEKPASQKIEILSVDLLEQNRASGGRAEKAGALITPGIRLALSARPDPGQSRTWAPSRANGSWMRAPGRASYNGIWQRWAPK